MTDHVVMFSGGVGSWATAKFVAAEMPKGDRLRLLFADTLMEDPDLYRFLDEAAANVGGELVKISDGRDVWQVFHDVRYLGNTRIDPCSYHLKRKLMREWLETNCAPESTVCYIGIDAGEEHRYTKAKRYWEPWRCEAPLIEHDILFKSVLMDMLAVEGIAPPALYAKGFPHNNCGGFCIKGGIDHFALLLAADPERYTYHERKEQELREYLDKDVSILRDRSAKIIAERLGFVMTDLTRDVDENGKNGWWTITASQEPLPKILPLTMRRLRERIERGGEIGSDGQDIGGCNCVNPDADVDAEIEGLVTMPVPVVPRRKP